MDGEAGAREVCKSPRFLHQTPHQTQGFALSRIQAQKCRGFAWCRGCFEGRILRKRRRRREKSGSLHGQPMQTPAVFAERSAFMQTPGFPAPISAQNTRVCMDGRANARGPCKPPPFTCHILHKSQEFAWAGASARAKMQTTAFHASNPAPNEGVCIAAPAPSAALHPGRRICSARLRQTKPLLHFRRTAADPRARTSELQRSLVAGETVAAFPTFGSRPPSQSIRLTPFAC